MNITEEAIEAAGRMLYENWDKRSSVSNIARSDRKRIARALEAASPHSMNVHLIQQVLELHSEDIFRGHLSNGCSICGPDNDEHYPCKTVQLLRKALEEANE